MGGADEKNRCWLEKQQRVSPAPEREWQMDLDDNWPLDQIPSFLSNPMSPFLFSSSELPSSPLWAFSDANEDPNAAAAFAAAGSPALPGSFRRADSTQFISYNRDTVTDRPTGNEDKRSGVVPPLEFVSMEIPDGSFVIKERMTQALRYLKESTEQHILAQVWAPVKSGGQYVLTTSGQPFVLDPHSTGLHKYRMVSVTYMFSVDGDSNGEVGLPARVFQQKLPEWTPNVKYYSSDEYPRLRHALTYNVQGTLALPIFEPSGQSCVGVLELILTSQKINYRPDVDKVCKALEAVNLKSSEVLDHSNIQICNEGRQKALAEILEILTALCETYRLPLAQTWVPCRHRNVLADGGGLKKSCSSFDGSCMGQVCMSTIDTAFYIVDPHIWGFREACAEHHLQKAQGVAGKAFASHNICFCGDITQFSKKEYPLVHYARLFGLTSCFAICLRSTQTGNDDYVLEFFLPPSITDSRDQQTLLESLLATMKEHFQNLTIEYVKELGEETAFEVIKSSHGEELQSRLECIGMSQAFKPPASPETLLDRRDKTKIHPLDHELMVDVDNLKGGKDVISMDGSNKIVPVLENKDTKKTTEKKRGKTEKSISLEVLQKYFAGSLKEAAKSLGVCPTTMKRICRQHGISRWPSRKIKKVNRSLSKLKRVIESVQGAEGAIDLTAFTSSPLPSISWPAGVVEANEQNSPFPKPTEKGLDSCRTSGSNEQAETGDEVLRGVPPGCRIFLHEQNGLSPEGDGSSKTRNSSRDENSGTPTSHGSCHTSPANETVAVNDTFNMPAHINVESTSHMKFLLEEPVDANLSAALPVPQEPFGLLVGDAGSSKDLKILCTTSDALLDEPAPDHCWTHPPYSDVIVKQPVDDHTSMGPHTPIGQDERIMIIKATYREDIIRFRISSTSGITGLQEEVAKRLKLDVGTFEIKYLDDDDEWVLIACDADLQECIDISRSSGSNITRLQICDIMANLGSSCESSGD